MGNQTSSSLSVDLKHKSLLLAASSLLIAGCSSTPEPKPTKVKPKITRKVEQKKPQQQAKQQTKPKAKKCTYYTIKPGDTFYSIARKVYGEAKYWKSIYEANKAVHPNPNALMIGQELQLPVIEKPKPPKEVAEKLAKKESVTAKKKVAKAKAVPRESKMIKLTKTEIMEVGKRIYKNECGGSTQFLTVWNKGEAFPSFGIGHFIWFPKGLKSKFVETFPGFIKFAHEKGAVLPPPLVPTKEGFDAPWTDRNHFMENINHRDMIMIRHWLAGHITLQTEYIIRRSENALPQILASLPADKQEEIRDKYYKMANSKGGMYPLIDYVNFKGEGTSPKERYKQQGWGLLQVLEQMRPDTKIGDENYDSQRRIDERRTCSDETGETK